MLLNGIIQFFGSRKQIFTRDVSPARVVAFFRSKQKVILPSRRGFEETACVSRSTAKMSEA